MVKNLIIVSSMSTPSENVPQVSVLRRDSMTSGNAISLGAPLLFEVTCGGYIESNHHERARETIAPKSWPDVELN